MLPIYHSVLCMHNQHCISCKMHIENWEAFRPCHKIRSPFFCNNMHFISSALLMLIDLLHGLKNCCTSSSEVLLNVYFYLTFLHALHYTDRLSWSYFGTRSSPDLISATVSFAGSGSSTIAYLQCSSDIISLIYEILLSTYSETLDENRS